MYSALQVYNDLPEYNLYGVIDNIEVIQSKDGDFLNNKGELCKLRIVEFKPTKPAKSDYRYDDFMQVFAQKVCIDYMFSCNAEAEIYYADVNKRYKLPVNEEFYERNEELKSIISEIRLYINEGVIPQKKDSQNCCGCSFEDLCMPKHRKSYNLIDEIHKIEKMEEMGGDEL